MDSDGEDDRPLILRAAYHSRLDILRRAIADGADVNVANENRFTALDFIINWGDDDKRFECIEALVEAGADLNRIGGLCLTLKMKKKTSRARLCLLPFLLFEIVLQNVKRSRPCCYVRAPTCG